MKIYKNHIELITENSTENLIGLIVDYINKLEINSNSYKVMNELNVECFNNFCLENLNIEELMFILTLIANGRTTSRRYPHTLNKEYLMIFNKLNNNNKIEINDKAFLFLLSKDKISNHLLLIEDNPNFYKYLNKLMDFYKDFFKITTESILFKMVYLLMLEKETEFNILFKKELLRICQDIKEKDNGLYLINEQLLNYQYHYPSYYESLRNYSSNFNELQKIIGFYSKLQIM